MSLILIISLNYGLDFKAIIKCFEVIMSIVALESICTSMFDVWAEEVTYGGVLISGAPRYEGDQRQKRCFLTVRIADVPLVVYRTSVVIGGETWVVQHETKKDTYYREVLLVRNERPVR